MKRLAMFLLAIGLFAPLCAKAQLARWDLSRDLQMSFTQRSDGVWYFMESESLVHDPAVYRLLTQYLFPCGFTEVGCWRGVEDHPSVCPSCVERTGIGFNFTNKIVGRWGGPGDGGGATGYLPHVARLSPTSERFSIVAWQSPVTGTVKVSAKFRERSSFLGMALSAIWSIDKGNQTLRSGRIGVGLDDGALAIISNLKVAKDDVLYFIVDDSDWGFTGEEYPIDLQVTITQVQ